MRATSVALTALAALVPILATDAAGSAVASLNATEYTTTQQSSANNHAITNQRAIVFKVKRTPNIFFFVNDEAKNMKPIQLLCPNDGNGALVVFSMNLSRASQLYRLYFERNIPIQIEVETAKSGGPYNFIVKVGLRNPDDTREYKTAKRLSNAGETLYRNVCIGTNEDRNNYRITLNNNKRSLSIPIDDYRSNFLTL
jgi:hypothetical protein